MAGRDGAANDFHWEALIQLGGVATAYIQEFLSQISRRMEHLETNISTRDSEGNFLNCLWKIAEFNE